MEGTVLVTGGAGFVGATLVRELVRRGARVRVLDDLSCGRLERIAPEVRSGAIEFLRGSVLDRGDLASAVRDVSAIVHLAAIVGVERVVRDPERALLENVAGVRAVLGEALRIGAPLVFASSSEVYGPGDGRAMREDDEPLRGAGDSSRWSYAVAKLAGERMIAAAARSGAVRGISLRFFNTTGPEQTPDSGMVLPRFCADAVERGTITVHGDGSQVRSFSHVADVAAAVADLLQRVDATFDGRVFNVGSGRAVSVLELAHLVAARTGASVRTVPHADAFGPDFEDVRHRVPDLAALRDAIGQRRPVPLELVVDEALVAARQRASSPIVLAAP
ncbi:MAG: NAD-dependent epimerase/dehydratase family protein [Planctomycetota bacterium]